MRVRPDAGELFGPPSQIDLVIEQFGHGAVIERDRH